MKKFICKNQQIIDESQALVSINERAFLFGDGIFETCKIFNGKIFDFNSHKKRISKGLNHLKISVEISNLEKFAQKLIEKNQVKNGILRISISRGIGSVGYLPTNDGKPLIIIQTLAERALPEKISLGISKEIAPKNYGFKSMNAMNYILAKINAQADGFFDAVMLNEKKLICETSSANIFWVKNGKIFTSKKNPQILCGTLRNLLLKISPIKIFEVNSKISALKNADEIFLTNSSFLLISVDNFLGKKLKKTLAQELKNLLISKVEKSCKN